MKKNNNQMPAHVDFTNAERGKFYGKVKYVRKNPSEGSEPQSCPFCGSIDLYEQSEQFDKADGYWIGCRACGSSGPLMPSKREALAAWNSRDRDEAA